jgi:hypothetical protein
MFGEAIFDFFWDGLDRLTQRAFEGPKRNRPERVPTPSQSIVKAIREGRASDAQVAEALDFGLASQTEGETIELTPLGDFILSRHPAERSQKRRAPKAAAA